MQTTSDWEQILLVDNIGRGLLHANGMFLEHEHEVNGQYVYILDDDNRLATEDVVGNFREQVVDDPKLVICKARVNDYIMPHPWLELPFNRGGIDSGCYFVRSDIWKKYIAHFRQQIAGDYHFIHAVCLGEQIATEDIVWWDKLVSLSMRDRPHGETTDRVRK